MRLRHGSAAAGDDATLLRAATVAVARAAGWTKEQVEAGTLEGSLSERQAKAALDVAREAGAYFLSADEARLLLACMALLQKHQASVLEGQLKYLTGSSTDLLEGALASSQALDALRLRVEGWAMVAEQIEVQAGRASV